MPPSDPPAPEAALSGAPSADTEAVPDRYLGVWQRRVLEQEACLDTRSQVLWLQTARWHADLRIPPDRPDFSGIGGLEDCDDDRLAWLATQQGFCGITEVSGARCQWHRRVDFQPDSGRRDLGQMAFNGDRLIEVGGEADYLEVWQRLPDGKGGSVVLGLADASDRPPARRTWLLIAGQWFAYVRARAGVLPAAASLSELIALRRPSHGQLLDWLDFEISFGRRDGAEPWRIEHSTLPFREGDSLFQAGPPQRLGPGIAVDGDQARWEILEWDLGRL